MKKNELGFMLAETLIVATFISVILIYLFVQFRNINNNYEKTLKYNGVNEMYILEQVYNYLGNIDLNQMSSNIIYGDKDYYVLSDCEGSVFSDTASCQKLFEMAEIEKAIYLKGDNLIVSDDFPNRLNDYIKTIKKNDNLFVIAALFNDGSVANIKISGYSYSSLIDNLKAMPTVSSGNGLYHDYSITSQPIYVFKGDNMELLNNNIELLGYNGRIIFADDVGVKVYLDIKSDEIYDNSSVYFTSTNRLSSGNYIGASVSNSSLFTNLNSKNTTSDYIKIGAKYGVGQIDNILGSSLASIIEKENSAIYEVKNLTDYVTTLNISDIIRTSINVGCNNGNISDNCLLDNWLSNNLWTMNYKDASHVWTITENKFQELEVGSSVTKSAYLITYLDPNIIVTGDGTKSHPFRIKK